MEDRTESPELASTSSRMCDICRFARKTCVCSAVPSPLVRPSGLTIVLQHPKETKAKDNTIKLLSLALDPSAFVWLKGRQFSPQRLPHLFQFLNAASERQIPIRILYPSDISTEITRSTRSKASDDPLAAPLSLVSDTDATQRWTFLDRLPSWILIAIDGTWTHALEMAKLGRPYWTQIPFLQEVHLPLTEDIRKWTGDHSLSELRPRRQPNADYFSSAAAVAIGVTVLDDAQETNLCSALTAPLRRYVKLMANFDPDIRERLAMEGTSSDGTRDVLTRLVTNGNRAK